MEAVVPVPHLLVPVPTCSGAMVPVQNIVVSVPQGCWSTNALLVPVQICDRDFVQLLIVYTQSKIFVSSLHKQNRSISW